MVHPANRSHHSLADREAASETACSVSTPTTYDKSILLGLFFKWMFSPSTEIWKMLVCSPLWSSSHEGQVKEAELTSWLGPLLAV